MALLIIPVLKWWSRARGPYGYLRTWNWPITAREISQPYNNNELFNKNKGDRKKLWVAGNIEWIYQISFVEKRKLKRKAIVKLKFKLFCTELDSFGSLAVTL